MHHYITSPVKLDFSEKVLKFDSNVSSILYMFRFEAFDQKFNMATKRMMIRNFKLGTLILDCNTVSLTKDQKNLTFISVPITSAVTTL